MREEAELWGMKYSPYPPYEVLKTKNISYDELILLKNIEHMVDKYLNSKKFNNILNYFIKKIIIFSTLHLIFMNSYRLFYKERKKGYFKRNISSSEYYKVFFDFNNEILRVDDKLLCDLIKFDYLTL